MTLIVSADDVWTFLGVVDDCGDPNPTDAQTALLNLIHKPIERVVKRWLRIEATFEQTVEYLPTRDLPRSTMVEKDWQLRGSRAVLVAKESVTDQLGLRNTPVWNQGLEVREDRGAYAGQASSPFGATTVLTQGTDYYLDIEEPNTVNSSGTPEATGLSYTGILFRLGSWPVEPRTVKVTYYGGETATRLNDQAGDLKYGMLLTLSRAWAVQKQWANGSGGPKRSETIGKYRYTREQSAAIQTAMASFTIPPEAQQVLWPLRNLRRVF